MSLYVATKPLEIRVTPERVMKVAPLVPFNLDEKNGAKLEKSVPFRTGIIQRHDGPIDKKEIEAFGHLGLAVLLSSEQYGDVWLIPNQSARTQVGLEAVTILPEELEILQTMEPTQIKRVFLVKRQFPGAKITKHGEIH